jgi:hypothetical protein
MIRVAPRAAARARGHLPAHRDGRRALAPRPRPLARDSEGTSMARAECHAPDVDVTMSLTLWKPEGPRASGLESAAGGGSCTSSSSCRRRSRQPRGRNLRPLAPSGTQGGSP